MSSSVPHPILTPQDLRTFEQLRIAPRRRFAGRLRGERLSRRKGVSIEFADYRDYTSGDDLRHLDWNILARHDRPTIRTYQDEEDLAIHLFLDTSASMDFGSPTKFHLAQRLAVALSFIGLCGHDAVTPAAPGDAQWRSFRSPGALQQIVEWASRLRPTTTSSFAQYVTGMLNRRGVRPGIVVLISDGLEQDAPAMLRSIGARGHDLLFLQVVSGDDADPQLDGDLRLIDSESGETVEITISGETLDAYRQNLAEHCRKLEQAAGVAGGRWLSIDTASNLTEIVTQSLRNLGAVK